MFIPPIAQSRKPSREPKNKKSILAATFLRLAIVPSCRITDHGAKVQVIRHETSDSCFAWDERELLIAKKLQKYLDFCFDNGRICRSRTNPAKDRLPTAATKSIPRNGGMGQPITDVSIPSAFLMTRIRSTPADPGLNRARFSSAIKGLSSKKRKAHNANQSRITRSENPIAPRSCRPQLTQACAQSTRITFTRIPAHRKTK